MGAVQAHTVPLTPCIAPTTHERRKEQIKEMLPLSLHHGMNNYAPSSLGLHFPLPLSPRPFLGGETRAETGLSS